MRLEDMNLLFGDATTAMPTPATQAERGSLMGAGSPQSLDIRRGGPEGLGVGHAIPGLDIDPPDVSTENGKVQLDEDEQQPDGEGLGGWISRMVKKSKGDGNSNGSNGRGGHYRRLDEADED